MALTPAEKQRRYRERLKVKEKTAPCKRPANLTSYAADPRQECGPMSSINGDRSAAFAAIDAMLAE